MWDNSAYDAQGRQLSVRQGSVECMNSVPSKLRLGTSILEVGMEDRPWGHGLGEKSSGTRLGQKA